MVVREPSVGHQYARIVLVLWSASGPLGTWYSKAAGPLALWRAWGDDVEGHPVEGGHFFPEEAPGPTAEAFHRFFRNKG